jgi:hypothetical protein
MGNRKEQKDFGFNSIKEKDKIWERIGTCTLEEL